MQARSSKSNAFFTGFGRHRRIALFDTLVAQLAGALKKLSVRNLANLPPPLKTVFVAAGAG